MIGLFQCRPLAALSGSYVEGNEHVPHINKYVPDMGLIISKRADERHRREEQVRPRRREFDHGEGGRNEGGGDSDGVDTEAGKGKIG